MESDDSEDNLSSGEDIDADMRADLDVDMKADLDHTETLVEHLKNEEEQKSAWDTPRLILSFRNKSILFV